MKLKELFESTGKSAIGKSVADLKIDYKGGDFDCYSKQLTSLEGSPSRVDGRFYCPSNELISLEGAPEYVGGNFFCTDNKLTSLDGAPRIIRGGFLCGLNQLTSLEGVHRLINEVKGVFNAKQNPIKSHVLGLLLIKGVTRVLLDNTKVENIINNHLGEGRAGMLQAQEELIEAGLEEFAQL